MTFSEAKRDIIAKLTQEAELFATKVRESFRLAAEQQDTLSMVTVIELSGTHEDYNILRKYQSAIKKLKDLDTVSSKQKWRTGDNLENIHFKGYVTAPNPKWADEIKCSYENMRLLAIALFNEDKKEFHNILTEITNNRKLTDRYTKHIFGNSVKH